MINEFKFESINLFCVYRKKCENVGENFRDLMTRDGENVNCVMWKGMKLIKIDKAFHQLFSIKAQLNLIYPN